MPRDKHAFLRMVAVGQRNARVARHARRRCDARHHLERHARSGQGLQLVAATAKDKRVAPLQAHHPLAHLAQAHQQRVDVLLAHRVVIAPLARVNAFSMGRHKIQNGVGDELVIHNHLCLRQQTHGPQGQQIWVTRPRTDKGDVTGRGARRRLSRGHQFNALQNPAA